MKCLESQQHFYFQGDFLRNWTNRMTDAPRSINLRDFANTENIQTKNCLVNFSSNDGEKQGVYRRLINDTIFRLH